MFEKFYFRIPDFSSIFLFIFLLLAVGCEQNETSAVKPNIILMIGDGMGVAQVSIANYWNPEKSNFYRFNTVGLIETSSTSHKVTDSASGATAFSIGEKTYKRAIGVASDSTRVQTILEELRDKGYKTGLISLTSITHATPASFYAHVADRDMHEQIAAQLVDAEVDFFAGGGWKYFQEREDDRNLFRELSNDGYVVDSLSMPSQLDQNMKYGFLMARESLPSKINGRTDFLQKATDLALDYFEAGDEPYFLMIEGSYIDWGGHAENVGMLVEETLDFDRTIGAVLDRTIDDDNTLLVVSADHETGGVSVGKYYEENESGGRVEVPDTLGIYFNTDQHTAELIPVFAKGYKEELFSGVYTNEMIYHKLIEATELLD